MIIFMSGADCAITSSYQATLCGFMEKGFKEDKAIDLIRLSVKAAKKHGIDSGKIP